MTSERVEVFAGDEKVKARNAIYVAQYARMTDPGTSPQTRLEIAKYFSRA